MSTTRRAFLKAAGVAAGAIPMGLHGAGHTAAQRSKPNILVILADDLGYGDLSSFGGTDIRTPHIDALMDAGLRWEPFHANCPVCSPTRAALMTGRYPDLAGVPGVIRTHPHNSYGYLVQDAPLLPERLGAAGYHCAHIGKWHLGLESPNTPTERGFDHFHGFLGDMMDDYYTHRRHGNNYMRLNGETIDPEGHATDLFTDWAVEYLREREDTKEPFFLYLAYNAPHTPIQPPAEWLGRVKARETNISEDRAKLVALIEHMDDGIGRVIQALKDTGGYSNTLIVFTSDNGGQLNVGASNGPLHGGKQDMYEGGLRVPMCAVWPGQIDPGVHEGTPALTMDLFPTLCEVAEASPPDDINGVSMIPALLGNGTMPEDRLLFWVRREGGPYGGQDYYAVRYGPWKLMQNTPFEPMRLYNLEDDPKEEKPLPTGHAMHQKLAQALQRHLIRAGAVPWQPNPSPVTVPEEL